MGIIIGSLLFIAGMFDSYKYSLQAFKIQKLGTAKGQSRKFNNFALWFKVSCIVSGIYTHNWYLVACAIAGLFCVMHLFYITYLYYPYRYRNLLHFKKPSLFVYFVNSLISNKKRKRL